MPTIPRKLERRDDITKRRGARPLTRLTWHAILDHLPRNAMTGKIVLCIAKTRATATANVIITEKAASCEQGNQL